MYNHVHGSSPSYLGALLHHNRLTDREKDEILSLPTMISCTHRSSFENDFGVKVLPKAVTLA